MYGQPRPWTCTIDGCNRPTTHRLYGLGYGKWDKNAGFHGESSLAICKIHAGLYMVPFEPTKYIHAGSIVIIKVTRVEVGDTGKSID